ncbi:MAG TPA: hypothetical protein ENH55_13205 [Aurantimonas coralicida]|uniref:Tail tubular protein A n=2 Tax=root TaxID=1 RepID=A0A0F9WPN2_9ZZZZ|nr:hypothetical protein [Aurantimonas coralicida]
MATDQLALYNIALAAVGERSIASLTEGREPRRLLDEIWNRGAGAIEYFLEQGYWNFAIRTVQIDRSTSVSTSFGFTYVFDIPTDYIRLVQLSAGEYFDDPLVRYEPEQAFIYADVDPIYMRYISDDASFGNDLTLWPETFTLWAGHWLATQIGARFLNDADYKELQLKTKRYLIDARSKDAAQEPPRWPPLSSWARARFGRSTGRRDRGSRGQLIG